MSSKDFDSAQMVIMDRLNKIGIETEMISDAGTVENLVDFFGYRVKEIANGLVSDDNLKAAIAWLD